MLDRVTFAKRRANSPGGYEARVDGNRSSRLVGDNGELNAGSKKELISILASLQNRIAAGDIDPHKDDSRRQTAKERFESLATAYRDRTSSRWMELGAAIGAEITESADREGFMRRMMLKCEVAQGTHPRIRVKRKNSSAIQASGPSQLKAVMLRDNYHQPPEWWIKANIAVDEREILQGSGDILEDKFYETLEQISVVEDRVWKSMADATVGQLNELQILAGGLTPASLAACKEQLTRWGLPALQLMLASDLWNDITGNSAFAEWFDPVSQYEIIMTGNIGNLLGMSTLTDAYREPQIKVLNQGELYITTSPEYHGAYTDRGPLSTVEINHAALGDNVPARGWSFSELISMIILNNRSVVKGIRQ